MNNKSSKHKIYQNKVEKVSPKVNALKGCIAAFFVGGTICTIGEGISYLLRGVDISKEQAGTWTSIILIFLGALLTGLDIYDSIGKYAGAGSVVPITGFANSVVAPAIEYKKEGYIFGVGAKMFIIAGPVIVYSTIASVVLGVIYYVKISIM